MLSRLSRPLVLLPGYSSRSTLKKLCSRRQRLIQSTCVLPRALNCLCAPTPQGDAWNYSARTSSLSITRKCVSRKSCNDEGALFITHTPTPNQIRKDGNNFSPFVPRSRSCLNLILATPYIAFLQKGRA